MATDKPKIVIYAEPETIEKLDVIAKEENRSRSNMALVILERYIKDKEKDIEN